MSVASGEDYEHWPDDVTQVSSTSVAASGYNGYNGLREYQYHPADDENKAQPAPEPPKVQPIQYAYQPPAAAPQAPYMNCYPQPPQYAGYHPQQMACYPAPQYYGYPGQQAQAATPPYGTPVMYVPAPVAVVEEEKPKKKKIEPRKWQGRTKAEVEEDNMKIAAREGTYAARKVEPQGLKEDQVVWVVGEDEEPVLQTYAMAKDLKGEWKSDPRYKDSWYSVREKAEEKVEEKVEKKCTCRGE
ncbi:hypothetical protein LTR37_016875 [Vermiconidia calcicola]|uniref:Uncharacterized protein n=1 Tax=Vermiconidia calcicola TaxID=1690605 RepID=A0ACC3MLN5_9PEZI|nr:hypothetical protein LTR37_016875 [Vermiconidia calcicola]